MVLFGTANPWRGDRGEGGPASTPVAQTWLQRLAQLVGRSQIGEPVRPASGLEKALSVYDRKRHAASLAVHSAIGNRCQLQESATVSNCTFHDEVHSSDC